MRPKISPRANEPGLSLVTSHSVTYSYLLPLVLLKLNYLYLLFIILFENMTTKESLKFAMQHLYRGLTFTFSGAENISYLKQQSSQMLDLYSSMKNTPNMYTSLFS